MLQIIFLKVVHYIEDLKGNKQNNNEELMADKKVYKTLGSNQMVFYASIYPSVSSLAKSNLLTKIGTT